MSDTQHAPSLREEIEAVSKPKAHAPCPGCGENRARTIVLISNPSVLCPCGWKGPTMPNVRSAWAEWDKRTPAKRRKG